MGCDVWACKNLRTCVQVTSSYHTGGGEKLHRNDSKLIPNCTAPHPTVQSLARKPQISRHHCYTSAMVNLCRHYFKIRWIASLSDYVKVKVSLYTLWIDSGTGIARGAGVERVVLPPPTAKSKGRQNRPQNEQFQWKEFDFLRWTDFKLSRQMKGNSISNCFLFI